MGQGLEDASGSPTLRGCFRDFAMPVAGFNGPSRGARVPQQ